MDQYDNLRKYVSNRGSINTYILEEGFIAPCKESLHKEMTFDQFKKKVESLYRDALESIKNPNAPANSDKKND